LTRLAAGGESLNPLTSGKMTVGSMPFYRSVSVTSPGLDPSQKTNGVAANLTWDNRDFVTNPSLGQSIKLSFSRDPGWFGSTNSWSFVEAEVDQYFSLGSTERFRQRVLALDVWTGTSPSWEYRTDGTVANRPPTF
jgi:outer membrane protein assembly factor BamA